MKTLEYKNVRETSLKTISRTASKVDRLAKV
jgi:hypothetical protein